MTLKTRNRLYLSFALISSVFFLFNIFIFFYAFLNHGITPPENVVRTVILFGGRGIFSYSFRAVLAGILALAVYVPLTAFVMYFSFEKTQSSEIIYFGGFLIGTLLESFRIYVPLFGLWESFSSFLMIVGSTVIAGRLLTVLSLMFATLFSESEQRQNVERNFIILLIISIMCGIMLPLDTTQTTSTCTVLWGYRTIFTVIRTAFFIAAVSVMAVNAILKSSPEQGNGALGLFLLYSGYAILTIADCWIETAVGPVLLLAGSFIYLKSIHHQYMWH